MNHTDISQKCNVRCPSRLLASIVNSLVLVFRFIATGTTCGKRREQVWSRMPRPSPANNYYHHRLTCQMGIHVPEDEKAWIRVGPETRRWKEGECLLYDTTYEHETMNEHPEQERVVLHVDFFNTLALTPTEIEVMQYIYSLREEFMKAEGRSSKLLGLIFFG